MGVAYRKYAMALFHNLIVTQQQTLNVSFGALINFVSGTSLFLYIDLKECCAQSNCFYTFLFLFYSYINIYRASFTLCQLVPTRFLGSAQVDLNVSHI